MNNNLDLRSESVPTIRECWKIKELRHWLIAAFISPITLVIIDIIINN